MPDKLADLTDRLLAAAKRAGADSADALAIDGTSVSVDVREGGLEQAERSEGVEIGLRVLIGQRQACVSASDVSHATIDAMAERAVAMAREAPADPHIGLADPAQLARDWDVGSLELADLAPEPAPDTLQDDARRAEAAALEVPGVSKVDGASAGYGRRALHLSATNGFSGGYARTSRSVSCVAITGTGTGMERDYFGEGRTFQADLPDAAEVGRIAGERTAARAGARKPPSGRFPVVYDERISSGLIGHLLQAINGQAIARGSSWLRDAMGEQVLPAALSLVENPHRARISGSRPFDAEGLATQPRDIVRDGTLLGWTLDLATARQLNLSSTASAARGTSAPPSPSVSNIALTQGTQSRDNLIRDAGTGLLVTSLIGSSINPTTGDYSRGASGFWIENGQIAYPVNECTLAGNLRDMLLTLIPANDARPHLSRLVPSLLVEGLTLADPDLDLLIRAAHDAAEIASRFWQTDQRIVEKPDSGGPVSEGDLAVDAHLRATLTAARPDYGWLSEETEDSPARTQSEHVFIVDPIDGTRAYIAGHRTWAHSLAVTRNGQVTAAVVLLPQRDKLYTATLGGGARLNDAPLTASHRTELQDARVLAPRPTFDPEHWPGGVPPIARHFRPSLAYRLCLVAEGQYDAMLTLRDAWEWDIAAGALIATEAGATTSDRHGAPLAFNSPRAMTPGVLTGAPRIHRALRQMMPPSPA